MCVGTMFQLVQGKCLLYLLAAVSAAGAPLHFSAQQEWLEVPIPSAADGQIAVGDVNGDGKADMVFYNPDRGRAWVALSTGRSFQAPVQWSFGLPKTSAEVQFTVADVNGDGKADFIAFVHGDGQSAGSANVYVALSTGAGFQYPQQPVWNAGFCITEQVCKVADVNGDGKADLIAFTPRFGLVWVSLSTGASFGANAVWNRYFCLLGEVCETGDVGGTKKSGLVLFKPHGPGQQKGNVLLSSSTGSSFGPAHYGHGYFCIDTEQCRTGDFNGDGKSDVLLVKGSGSTSLEMLVSLSNGQNFINANPFSWGHAVNVNKSSAFGSFFIGDFNGDGKADLLQTDVLSMPTGGGGSRIAKSIYWVHLTTDKAEPPPPPAPAPVPTGGVKEVNIYNCDTDQHRLYYWVFDATANTTTQRGPVDAMYSAAGTCPDSSDAPETFALTNGHTYQIAAVDPAGLACNGQNDPNVIGCRRDYAVFLGNSKGPSFNWIVPSR